MPRRDYFHDTVRAALIADGWQITDDPFTLQIGDRNVFVDLGAEIPAIAAERQGRKIAVEIKGFRGPSMMSELEGALGQFVLYAYLLKRKDPERTLYVAIPEEIYTSFVRVTDVNELVAGVGMRLVVVAEDGERIVKWTEP